MAELYVECGYWVVDPPYAEGDEACSVGAIISGGGDSTEGRWWRSPRHRKAKAKSTVEAQSERAQLSGPAPGNMPEIIPHLDQIKAEIAGQVDEILRQQGRIDREQRRQKQAKIERADKRARAALEAERRLAFARQEAERQRLAEEALEAHLRAMDDDDAIVLAMSI